MESGTVSDLPDEAIEANVGAYGQTPEDLEDSDYLVWEGPKTGTYYLAPKDGVGPVYAWVHKDATVTALGVVNPPGATGLRWAVIVTAGISIALISVAGISVIKEKIRRRRKQKDPVLWWDDRIEYREKIRQARRRKKRRG